MSGEAFLEASGLTLSRGGAKVLDNLALAVGKGEILGLIGPNGAGKSTLLLTMAGLLKPSGGTVRLGGEQMLWGPAGLPLRRRMAVVFQEPLLFDRSVAENIASGLSFRGVRGERRAAAVAACLERFQLTGLASRNARTLSGGEAQRASLARAFAVSPEVLFLDEPFSPLDPPTRESLLEELKTNLRTTGTTAVFVTHDRDEALRLCDRIAVLARGRIVQAATPEELLNRPADEFVAQFVGVETLLPGVVRSGEDGVLTVSVGQTLLTAVGRCKTGEHVLLCIRPENVTLMEPSAAPVSSARNRLAGKVAAITFAGALCRVRVDCGFTVNALLTSASAREMALEIGSSVALAIKTTAVHVLGRNE